MNYNPFFLKRSTKKLLLAVFLLTGFPAAVVADTVGHDYEQTYEQTRTFDIHLKNTTVKKIFAVIEANSEFVFLYSDAVLDDNALVSIDVKGGNIYDVMDYLSTQLSIDYTIKNRQVTILKRVTSDASDKSQQDKVKVTGIVMDKNGESLIGATVQERGTSNGTITDINGRYTLMLSDEEAMLQVSYVGYVSQTVKVKGKSNINITLYEDANILDEVVITAYGTGQKKESVVGSIQTVRPSDLKIPNTQLSNSFAGRLAGVIAVQRSGEPGADGSNFWIRGVSTLGSSSSSPLIIIDGIESTTAELNALDPEVIDGFSILKDATATAMYGMRGANGVMIVTTKSGASLARPIINFRIEGSMNTPTDIPEFVDGVTFMELYNEAVFNLPAGRDPYSQDKIEGTRKGLNPYIYPNVDWYNELFKKHSFTETINLNVRGGGSKVDYFSSVTISHEDGMLRSRSKDFFSYNNNINRMRYAFQNNVNAYLSKFSKLSLRLNVLLVDKRTPQQSTSDIFSSIMSTNPVDNPILYPSADGDSDIRWGVPVAAQPSSYGNPLAYMTTGYSDVFQNTLSASLTFEQKLDFLTKGLKFTAMASFKSYGTSTQTRSAGWNKWNMDRYWQNEDGTYGYELTRFGSQEDTSLSTSSSNAGNRRIYLQAMLDYNRTFGKHDVGALLIYNQDEYVNNNPGSDLLSALPERRQGVAFRASYGYDSRYLAEFNVGYNGSENFAEGNRFGFFPSIAVGYNISEERFFEPLKNVVSHLKIRASYGLVGNGEIGGERFAYLPDLDLTGSDSFTTGINMDKTLSGPFYYRYANNDLQWEVGHKYNVGFDLTLYNRFNLTFDVFREDRKDIFQERVTIPTYLGMDGTAVYGNFASVRNQGVDLSIDYGHQFNKDFEMTFKGTFTYAHNEITEYDEAVGNRPNLSRIGYSTSQLWGYVADHLFADQAEIDNHPTQIIGGTIGAGDIKYVNIPDANGNYDSVIDANDRVPIGNPTTPEIVYGFGPSFRWKNFDFSFFFQGVAKTSLMMSDLQPFGTGSRNRNVQTFIAENRWSPTNQNILAEYPRLTIESSANNSAASTYWLRDGSFLKLKNAEIGYTFKFMRVYLRGSNLLTFSKFDLWDPEQGGGNGLKYPTQRTINFGFQMTFK